MPKQISPLTHSFLDLDVLFPLRHIAHENMAPIYHRYLAGRVSFSPRMWLHITTPGWEMPYALHDETLFALRTFHRRYNGIIPDRKNLHLPQIVHKEAFDAAVARNIDLYFKFFPTDTGLLEHDPNSDEPIIPNRPTPCPSSLFDQSFTQDQP